MKKILFPIGLLAMLCVSACSSPTGKGEKVAQKFCECLEMKDINQQNECNTKATEEYNEIHREYIDDPQALKEFEDAYNSYRERNCSE